MNNHSTGFIVNQPGMLSLIQDAGRFGAHGIGLTTGGPLDSTAFKWANRLCDNPLNASVIEIAVGGLQLQAKCRSKIAVTGAAMPLKINGQHKNLWQSLDVQAGDVIDLGFAEQGARCYLAVAGGFQITPQFGSTATVLREKIGGIDGDKLKANDFLPCLEVDKLANKTGKNRLLVEKHQPHYQKEIVLRTINSYQQQYFTSIEQQYFYSSEYQVSERADRMGYRLQGRKISADIGGILSEGICYGAIQIPADGQPIILLNDRQTIGGYPKIATVISTDSSKIAQAMPTDKVNFQQVSMEEAHNFFHLELSLFNRTELTYCD